MSQERPNTVHEFKMDNSRARSLPKSRGNKNIYNNNICIKRII
jgi:hypothetical protein